MMNRMQSRGTRAVCGALLAVAAMAMPDASHAQQFQISGGITFADPGIAVYESYDLTLPIYISRQVLDRRDAPFAFLGRAGSGADQYGLHASNFVSGTHIRDGSSGGGIYQAQSFVSATYTDVVIDGPAGAVGTIQTPINFHLSGEQILGSYFPSAGHGSAVESTVSLQIFAGANGASGVNNFHYTNGIDSPADQRGMLVGFDGDSTVHTPLFTLPVNTPFRLQLILNSSAWVGVDFFDGYITSSLSDFGSTLSFATDGPVFDLPAGYTAHSLQAGIVNNAFAVDITPVPEPSIGVLAGVGLLAVAWWQRRRQGHAGPGAG